MISWVALDRVVETERAADSGFRHKSAGKTVRSDAMALTDDELLAKLRGFGIELERSSLERLCAHALSAEEIAKPLLDQHTSRGKLQMESDWVWVSLCALWQRWFPDVPSFEALDDKMQAGYQALASDGATAACHIWLEAWNDVLRLFDKGGMRSIQEFDERFSGTQSLFNWIQDLEDALWNAGLDERQFLTARIAVCEEGLRRFPDDDELTTENRRRALAESYFELGERATALDLYREWLQLDPRWGWGWIGWSDLFRFTRPEFKDWGKCEHLLREGLAVPDVRDRGDILDRLADACREQGRDAEAKELSLEAKHTYAAEKTSLSTTTSGSVLRQKTTIDFGDEGLPLSELSSLATMLRGKSSPVTVAAAKVKVGRNDPCPCGSGKKYKKCCGS